jgi:hypothetical protein
VSNGYPRSGGYERFIPMTLPTKTFVKTKTTIEITEVRNWTELVDAIRDNDGVTRVPMETLRRLEGAQRLGVHVLTSISARLTTMGVGHMPDALPNRQDQDAILYLNSTSAGELVSAIREGFRDPRIVKRVYEHMHRLNASPEPSDVIHRDEFADKLSLAAEAVLELLEGQGMATRR